MALFKIFNNFGNPGNSIANVENHKAGYCYFDISTNKFYVDTIDDDATGLRQLNGTFYGVCNTAANSPNKTVNIVGFARTIGVNVFIKFTNGTTASSSLLTLDISGTGAKNIKRYSNINLPNDITIFPGMICHFLYDGEYWLWVGYIGNDKDEQTIQMLTDINTNRPLLLSYADAETTSSEIKNLVYRSNKIYGNPNTGTITAVNFIGKINGHTVEKDVPSNAKFTDTTYTGTNGIRLESGNKFVNSGVRSIEAGITDGTLVANIDGVLTSITIPGFQKDAQGRDIADTYLTKDAGVTNVSWDSENKKITKTIDNTTTDVVDINTIKTALNLAKKDVGLNKVENIALSTWTGSQNITTVGTLNQLLVSGNASFSTIPTAPTPAENSNDTSIATTEFVKKVFVANEAMTFKGIVNSNTDLPSAHKKGWVYKVGTEGIYASQVCEVGDTIYCTNDGDSANSADWSIIQTNLDGAVIGPSSSTIGKVAVFAGTTGRVIKDSNFSIEANVPSDAKFTDMAQRTYRSSTNVELPIAGLSTSNSKVAAYAPINSNSYKDVYAAIPENQAVMPTLNPSTGVITAPGGIVGNAATATKLLHKLIFGDNGIYQFDGSEDVTVPTYTGDII